MTDALDVAAQIVADAGLLSRLITQRDNGRTVPPQSRHSRQASVLGRDWHHWHDWGREGHGQ